MYSLGVIPAMGDIGAEIVKQEELAAMMIDAGFVDVSHENPLADQH